MEKIIIAAAFVVLTTPAISGSCPGKIAMIDKALAQGNVPNAEQVKKLRDQGEKLHKEGGHGASVTVLSSAMKLAGLDN
jgi:hypothetical protein